MDQQRKEAAEKAALLRPGTPPEVAAKRMCEEKVYEGFCTKPVCHYEHDAAVFAEMQEANGFCLIDAMGKVCEAGA